MRRLLVEIAQPAAQNRDEPLWSLTLSLLKLGVERGDLAQREAERLREADEVGPLDMRGLEYLIARRAALFAARRIEQAAADVETHSIGRQPRLAGALGDSACEASVSP